MEKLLKLKNSFTDQGILISFNGPFTHSIIEEIGNAIKRYLEAEQLTQGTVSDVFSVYIEQTQNVRNYLSKNVSSQNQHNTAILVIGKTNSHYTVSSGNSILKRDVPALVKRLEEINSVEKQNLKAFYKEALRKPRDPESEGAGLGLIIMARKAVNSLDYSFCPLDEEYDFFSLNVTVTGEA